MKGKDERYPDYPLFKGLQRPLEFLGIQGRYIILGGGDDVRSHCRLCRRLLPTRFHCRACRAGSHRSSWYRAHPPQTAERTA